MSRECPMYSLGKIHLYILHKKFHKAFSWNLFIIVLSNFHDNFLFVCLFVCFFLFWLKNDQLQAYIWPHLKLQN